MGFFRNSVGSSLRENGMKKVSQPQRAYESFFEGYSAEQIRNKDGKLQVVREYTGTYYAADITDRKRRGVKILYAVSFGVLAAMMVYVALFSEAELPRYAELLHAAVVILMGWQLVGLIYYLPAPKDMKAHTFKRGTDSVRRSAGILSVCFAGLLVLLIVLMIIRRQLYFPDLVIYAAGAAISFLVFNTERRIEYQEITNGL